eukprot:1374433-Amorphochlora_amoeboformis.AAC.1
MRLQGMLLLALTTLLVRSVPISNQVQRPRSDVDAPDGRTVDWTKHPEVSHQQRLAAECRGCCPFKEYCNKPMLKTMVPENCRKSECCTLKSRCDESKIVYHNVWDEEEETVDQTAETTNNLSKNVLRA